MSRTAQDVLEFDKLRELLRLRTTCVPGRRSVDALEPGTDREALDAAFAQIREAREWLRAGREMGFGGLADPQSWLERLQGIGAVLEPRELLDAATLLETAGWLKPQFREEAAKFPLLAERAASLGDFRDLLAAIRRCILPNGDISDDASPALRRIRASISDTRASIQKTLKQILRARNAEAGEDYVTLRNDRFVIPVRAEHRRAVPGVMHGASATGQTVFLEPFETVETNNQLVQLAEDEAAEIVRILSQLTERLRLLREPLVAAADTIAVFDSVFARARFAQDFDAAMPEFSEAGELRLEARAPSGPRRQTAPRESRDRADDAGARRPGTPPGHQRPEHRRQDRRTQDHRNRRALRPSGNSRRRSARRLASFRSRARRYRRRAVHRRGPFHVLRPHAESESRCSQAATPQSLVLVDEMGTGTAPEEGAALAVALLDEFRAKNCIVLATTHHDRLKAYASTTPGVVNAAVEFDEINLRPTYRLMVGVPGGSSGIAIAQRLGLPASVIERARSLLGPESREAADLIAYLHRSRDEIDRMQQQMAAERHALEEERKKLRAEWVERQQRRIKDLEEKFAEMQKRFDENVASVVEAVKDRELRAQLEKSSRRKMQDARGEAREELNAAVVQTLSDSQADLGISGGTTPPPSPDRLQPGARIRVRGFSQPVILRRIEGSTADIEAGPLRMKVAVEQITGIESAPPGPVGAGLAPPSSRVTVTSRPGEAATSDEINVIGSTVEEATGRVDKFLDEAALANRQRVRIIHGHGTGALRKGLAQFLSSHPLVGKVSTETEDRGGKAITVVELRA